ncbi:hypothetical protein BP6252_13668 [Coleophoma cylindrospora]|uniref:Zn(2)-C6 fungal-type domain-containing protein n=1 Tax=Coleophoma cylindrospora TaxID=1849047 RepID=A0A3D8Q9C0_9HELO|nr:hypothetical protein BP6252_13668 [Coleophoma cylindrospora]
MAHDPSRTPKRPKLRSSCDACGAAKLKCDRGQPECGRCVSYEMPCVYGLSRKMGKPPRDRLLAGSKHTQTPTAQAVTNTGVDNGDNNSNDCGVGLDIGMFSRVIDVPMIWDAADDETNNFVMGALDGYSDLSGTSLPTLSSLDFGEWAIADDSNDNPVSTDLQYRPISQPELSDFDIYSSTGTAPQSQVNGISRRSSAMLPSPGLEGHDCPREAYEILGSLSFFKVSNSSTVPLSSSSSSSVTSSASATGVAANRVPFDHVLHLNREAIERFRLLANCSCAKSPQLTLLHASIISRILGWYRQAAGCTQGGSWSTPGASPDTASHYMSSTETTPSSSSRSGGGSSTWSSTTTGSGAFETNSANSKSSIAQSSGLRVAPTNVAIGTFNVDDPRVQTALKIQLLSGEMKRVGSLIDVFTAHTAGSQFLADQSPSGSVDSLYQSLNSWLRGEHSRIANMMKSRLAELNI